MSLGLLFAQAQAQTRAAMEPGAFGWPVVGGVAVKTYDCTSKNLSLNSADGLLLSGNTNVDSTDQRRITLNPADFTMNGVLTPPGEGQNCLYQGKLFTIKKTSVPELAFGVAIALPIEIFRAAPPASATAETTEEAIAEGHPQDAGKRKRY